MHALAVPAADLARRGRTTANLWAFDLATSNWRQLTNFGRDIVISDFDVSSDGREIVFERVEESSDVWMMDLSAP
jgi:Tol biopolymer transport system component